MAVQTRRTLQMFIVDAFTKLPFAGNPAAVCLDKSPEGLSDSLMQKIAMEMNLSETAFIRPHSLEEKAFENGKQFKLRWFTPTNEVPLCGHATLASAAVIFNSIGNLNNELTFDTLSGPLVAIQEGAAIKMVLPCNPPKPCDPGRVQKLLELALGPLSMKEVMHCATTAKVLVRIDDFYQRKDLEDLVPPISQFISAETSGFVKGVIVTLKGSQDNGCFDPDGRCYDFVSRYFAPWNGIPEDPVTGSAHTVLAPYWSKELGKTELYARQCSRRGGDLEVKIRTDNKVDIVGQATIVLQGSINIE